MSDPTPRIDAYLDGIERYAIPTPQDQPTNRFYNPKYPARYAPEWESPDQYPATLRQDVPVGHDPIADELKRTYGTADMYGFDRMCDPTYHGNGLNGNSLTGALPNAPIAGRWFDAMFVDLVKNAFPPLANDDPVPGNS